MQWVSSYISVILKSKNSLVGAVVIVQLETRRLFLPWAGLLRREPWPPLWLVSHPNFEIGARTEVLASYCVPIPVWGSWDDVGAWNKQSFFTAKLQLENNNKKTSKFSSDKEWKSLPLFLSCMYLSLTYLQNVLALKYCGGGDGGALFFVLESLLRQAMLEP